MIKKNLSLDLEVDRQLSSHNLSQKFRNELEQLIRNNININYKEITNGICGFLNKILKCLGLKPLQEKIYPSALVTNFFARGLNEFKIKSQELDSSLEDRGKEENFKL